MKPVFVAAAATASSLPKAEYPEIAFAGRSNVGKSSLINALSERGGTVRVSDKPGYTQTINFFRLQHRRLSATLMLVDLPGYGFAFANEEKIQQWNQFV